MRLWLWIFHPIIAITKQFCALLKWRKRLILLTISVCQINTKTIVAIPETARRIYHSLINKHLHISTSCIIKQRTSRIICQIRRTISETSTERELRCYTKFSSSLKSMCRKRIILNLLILINKFRFSKKIIRFFSFNLCNYFINFKISSLVKNPALYAISSRHAICWPVRFSMVST